MSSEGSTPLPPEALEDWAREIKGLLGLEDDLDIGAILDLARDSAHNVARPAAPLTAYALGLAVGRADDPESEFPRLLERLQARCLEWKPE